MRQPWQVVRALQKGRGRIPSELSNLSGRTTAVATRIRGNSSAESPCQLPQPKEQHIKHHGGRAYPTKSFAKSLCVKNASIAWQTSNCREEILKPCVSVMDNTTHWSRFAYCNMYRSCTCTYQCTYTHMHIHRHTYKYIYDIYIYIYIYMHIHSHVHIHIQMCIHIHTYTYIYIYI